MPGNEPVQSITSAPIALREEQARRTRRYLIMMGIRTACFILAIVLTGWLRWTAAAGAVVLPYIAVVIANAVAPRVYDQNASVMDEPKRPRQLRGRAI
ncbi:DUF3099 domain-containing protein [Kribbia dieselivorans]|uniref:DUF3099 domain-containing protein n=1 Tax=Kribbia dieselivorans TaxID=331526 RepID=UPI0008396695|nr:DUF3099 domain-containing protein [Kribbia dieselivorans]